MLHATIYKATCYFTRRRFILGRMQFHSLILSTGIHSPVWARLQAGITAKDQLFKYWQFLFRICFTTNINAEREEIGIYWGPLPTGIFHWGRSNTQVICAFHHLKHCHTLIMPQGAESMPCSVWYFCVRYMNIFIHGGRQTEITFSELAVYKDIQACPCCRVTYGFIHSWSCHLGEQ